MEEIALIIPTEPKRRVGGFTGMGFATEAPGEEGERRTRFPRWNKRGDNFAGVEDEDYLAI
jgi:hypothetical protein